MKAIRVHEFGGPENLLLDEFPPLSPAPGELVVEIRAAGVNPVDTYIRSGTHAIKPPLPYTPGTDGAGIVIAAGGDMKEWAPGDRVYLAVSLTGTYSQQALCLLSHVHRLPANISFSQGAALGIPYATAYRSLFQKARILPGESILIRGASGGVGIAALQMARSKGLTVIGTAGSESGRELIAAHGAEYVFDHNQDELPEKVRAVSKGGVDVVIEMLANKNLSRDLAMLRQGGRIVVVGSLGPMEFNPREIMAKDAAVLGMFYFNTPPADMVELRSELGRFLESDAIRPVIQDEIPLRDASQAHRQIAAQKAHGKIVLIP